MGTSGRFAIITVTALALAAGAVPCFADVTPNLLTNPGAETGDLTGWTAGGDSNPSVDNGSIDAGINPQTGSFDFDGGIGAVGTLTQTVTLAGNQGITPSAIDAGECTALLSFAEQGLDQGPSSDSAEVNLTFRDGSGAVLSTFSSGEIDSHNGAWEQYANQIAIPRGARTVDYQMKFVRYVGSYLDSYIDDNSLRVSTGGASLGLVNGTSVAARTGRPFRFQVLSNGGSAGDRLSTSALPPGLQVDPVTGVISGTPTSDGVFNVALTVTNGSLTAQGRLQLTFTSDPGLPVITSAYTAFIAQGQSFFYQIVAPATTTSSDVTTYSITGSLPAGLGFDPTTGVISGRLAVAKEEQIGTSSSRSLSGGALLGTIQLAANNSHGTATAPLTFFTAPAARAVNISTRLAVGTDQNALIGGFIITGTAPKLVILRGLGPSLGSQGVSGTLADPVLELRDQAGNLIVANDDWQTSQAADVSATGVAPADSHESAIVVVLQPGKYTGIVRGVNNGTGIGQVEAYDLGNATMDVSVDAQLANISTRGFVDTGESVLIGGFIAEYNSGNFLIRGIGPSLASQGVAGVLADPFLELHDSNGNTLQTNDDWQETQQAQIAATGVAPTDVHESAMIASLAPGNYTAIVRGVDNATGVALVEIYSLQ